MNQRKEESTPNKKKENHQGKRKIDQTEEALSKLTK